MFDLKDFRENKLKMSQEQFAKLIGVRQDTVSRMEKNPESITIKDAFKIASVTGTSLDQLLQYKKVEVKPLIINDTWKTSTNLKMSILQYCSSVKKDLGKDKYRNMINEYIEFVENSIVKPNVLLLGASDSGKSTLINALIGKEISPTGWTPTTTIKVYFKHIKDRPSFIFHDTCIYKINNDREIEWNDSKVSSKQYHLEWLVDSGDISILRNYAVRKDDNEREEVFTAVVYVDSPILLVCNLIDIPGFNTGDKESDDSIAISALKEATIMIYLSQANGFLKGFELEFIKMAMNYLPIIENISNDIKPLGNIFIIASQSHTVNNGNTVELNKILECGSKRLFSQIPKEIWENRQEVSGSTYTCSILRGRFFTYTLDIELLKEEFENNIKDFIEKYPQWINQSVNLSLKEKIISDFKGLDLQLNEYQNLLDEKSKYIKLLVELKSGDEQRKSINDLGVADVLRQIEMFKENCKEELFDKYNKLLKVENIIEIIDEKGYGRNREDIELLVGYINSKIQVILQKIFKNYSIIFSSVIDDYLKEFEQSIGKISSLLNSGMIKLEFDVRRIFSGTLVGLATIGSLATWASTLGNLGAYILVAKGVSILSAIGISIPGGTAGAASFVAAIGGPIVLGTVLAIIIAMSTFAIISSSWKKSISNKIIKEYKNKNVIEKYSNLIDRYWDDTKGAFLKASEETEKKYQEYISELEELVNKYDSEEVKKSMKNIMKMKEVLKYFPNE